MRALQHILLYCVQCTLSIAKRNRARKVFSRVYTTKISLDVRQLSWKLYTLRGEIVWNRTCNEDDDDDDDNSNNGIRVYTLLLLLPILIIIIIIMCMPTTLPTWWCPLEFSLGWSEYCSGEQRGRGPDGRSPLVRPNPCRGNRQKKDITRILQ